MDPHTRTVCTDAIKRIETELALLKKLLAAEPLADESGGGAAKSVGRIPRHDQSSAISAARMTARKSSVIRHANDEKAPANKASVSEPEGIFNSYITDVE